VAAQIRRELKTDVDMVHGKYGEFTVLVDGKVVVDGGSLAFLGVLPKARQVLDAVKTGLCEPAPPQ
jgi:hypothetical protein